MFVLAACYLLIRGVNFVGLTYLIVYVGAVAVLFLFVVIILNIQISEIVAVGLESRKNLPLGLIVGILSTLEFLSIYPALTIELGAKTFINATTFYLNLNISPIGVKLMNVFSTRADTDFSIFTQINSLGQGLYSYGALGLLIASCVLLLSILGPILTCQRQMDLNGSNPPTRIM